VTGFGFCEPSRYHMVSLAFCYRILVESRSPSLPFLPGYPQPVGWGLLCFHRGHCHRSRLSDSYDGRLARNVLSPHGRNGPCSHSGSAATSFAADTEIEFLGPYADNDAGTEVIRVRNTMYLPPRYARSLSAREAFERITTQIETDGLVDECQPLIDWLRVSITQPAVNERPRVEVAAPSRGSSGAHRKSTGLD
jgi:hypothetical protein